MVKTEQSKKKTYLIGSIFLFTVVLEMFPRNLRTMLLMDDLDEYCRNILKKKLRDSLMILRQFESSWCFYISS